MKKHWLEKVFELRFPNLEKPYKAKEKTNNSEYPKSNKKTFILFMKIECRPHPMPISIFF